MDTGQITVSLVDAKTYVEKAEAAVVSYVNATQRISIRFHDAADAKSALRKALREAIDRLELATLAMGSR